MIYNFLEGESAKLLGNLISKEIKAKSCFQFEPINNISITQISPINKHYYYSQGEDEYLMFAFLSRYDIGEYGLPRYHVKICSTREIFSGYVFSNKMPVRIEDKSNEKVSTFYLPLCKNCKREITLSPWQINNGLLSWEEYLLKKASDGSLANDRPNSDGYSVYWKQISYAIRSVNNFRCENCQIDLSNTPDQYFLEVHHIDHDKMNNKRTNLKCLCVNCHSKVDNIHRRNYSFGTNLLKLHAFRNRN